MKLPVIKGTIRRRLLVNYRVDPRVIQPLLPPGFRPKLQNDCAIAGICLIRLEHIRPRMLPEAVGLSSENAAHRVAVEWEDGAGAMQEGVYITRRDTNSLPVLLLGGRLFPGEHGSAAFHVEEQGREIKFAMKTRDGAVAVRLKGAVADKLPQTSVFPSLEAASAFFECGSLGYSPKAHGDKLEGMVLNTRGWHVEPLEISGVFSSFFAERTVFPKGSAQFDHALIMRDIASEWESAADLYV